MFSFNHICSIAPDEIKNLLEQCKVTPQSAQWHPEAPNDPVPHNVFAHIEIVYNRAQETGDIDFMVAALFHDLGKATTTKKHSTKVDAWPAHGHEVVSSRYVVKYKDWIESLGCNFDRVYYIVDQHMRIKNLADMRPTKAAEFKKDKYFSDVVQFDKFDNMLNLKESNELNN